MKRTFLMLMATAALSAAAAAAPADVEVIRSVPLDEVALGMRVKIQLNRGRPFIGTVASATPKMIGIDISTEERGLPGTVRFRCDEIMVVWELKPQSAEEKQQAIERRNQVVARIKVEVAGRIEKHRSQESSGETRAKAEEQDLRQAMDVVVKKEDEERMRALIEEYPPAEWGEETFRAVRENWILRDLQPTPQQSRFLKVFDEWKAARDTLAVLDARAKQEAGERLLIKFPPSEGWGKTKLDALQAKEAAGAALTDDEKEFQTSWADWSAAAQRRAAEVMATPAPAAPEKPPAKPADETPAPPAPEKPAEKAPDPPADAKAPDAPAPVKAPDPPAEQPAP